MKVQFDFTNLSLDFNNIHIYEDGLCVGGVGMLSSSLAGQGSGVVSISEVMGCLDAAYLSKNMHETCSMSEAPR